MTHRAHLGYVVDLARPLHHEDDDLAGGRFHDANGDSLGEVIFDTASPSLRFLLVVEDDMAAVHVEAILDADHRVESFAHRAVMRYGDRSEASAGIRDEGEAWESGEYVAFVFESEADARAAESRA